jgi:branched-chain amino acid transport system permease protein
LLSVLLNGLLVGGGLQFDGHRVDAIFGVMKVVNFAHGSLIMLGMYTSTAVILLRLTLPGDPGVPIVLFIIGACFQRFLINPF